MIIVLLHGWGCTQASWQPVRSELQKIGSVIALDLPGFGESPEIENFSLADVVDSIALQLPDACVLIGWSLGGMLAVQIAVQYPQKVSLIITLAANLKFVASADYPCAMPLAINQTFNKRFADEPIATLKLFSSLLAQGDANERVLLKKMRYLISINAVNANWLQALQLLSQLDNRAAFVALTQPGLHVFGDADALVPVSAAKELKKLNPQQTIKILPQAAHALQWSQPEKVIALITQFLVNEIKPRIDKKNIAKSFSRAARTYDNVAGLQRDVGEKLLQMIDSNTTATMVMDLGCGTGNFSQNLQKKFPEASIIGVDLAEAMLAVAHEKNPSIHTWLCGDAETLPFANNSIDIIFSSLALQWCYNLPQLFSELNRVLKPNGNLMLSTLGPQTLHELKAAWQQVDNYVHVNTFQSETNLKLALLDNGFAINTFSQQFPVLTFASLTDLTRELKALGAHNVNSGRLVGLTGRKKLAALKIAYENYRCDNLLPASYEVLYVVAEKLRNL